MTKAASFLTAKLQFLLSRSHFVGSVFVLLWPPGSGFYLPSLTLCLFKSISLHFSECFPQMISRTSQGTKPLFFPLATLMKPLCSPSLLTQIWQQKRNAEIKFGKFSWQNQALTETYFSILLLLSCCAGSIPVQTNETKFSHVFFLFKHESTHKMFSATTWFAWIQPLPITINCNTECNQTSFPNISAKHHYHSCSWMLLNFSKKLGKSSQKRVKTTCVLITSEICLSLYASSRGGMKNWPSQGEGGDGGDNRLPKYKHLYM